MLRFFAGGYTFVEFLEDRRNGLLEFRFPVEGAALGGNGAVGVHPVHAVFVDEPDEALGQFFDGLVEGFAGGMAVAAEFIVLGLHNAGQSSP